jgi:alpha-L-rhamnosidase
VKYLFTGLVWWLSTGLLDAQDYKTIRTDWTAQWIGARTPSVPNTWQRYRKTVHLDAVAPSVRAAISCDSKYWLWVNGRLVVFEGQLKRGPSPTGTYFDTVELAPYLQPGPNTLALLVWYWGREGFCHHSSGQAGLLFEARNGDGPPLVSDSTWRISDHPAFGNSLTPHPNFRLPEHNVRYDARLGDDAWIQPDFSDAAWPRAAPLAAAGGAPWGPLWQRPFGQWLDSGLLAYADSFPAVSDGKPLVMKLPRNLTVTPYFRIEAPAGLLIDLRSDNYRGGSEYNVRTEYLTRAGVQAFETPAYFNGHEVHYTFPKGVRLLDLRYRETRYPVQFVGAFSSDDPFFDQLWQKSLHTMNVNLRDAIQDPDRERAQWWGDAVIILEELFYSGDVPAHAAIRKSMSNLLEWQKPDGVLFSPIPAGNWDKELPAQMLAAVGSFGFGQYVRHTGDSAFVRYAYPFVKRYMDLWRTDARGLVMHRAGGWDWHDWGTRIDVPVLDNAWYYLALTNQRDMAQWLGYADEARAIDERMQRLREGFQAAFWKGNRFASDGFRFGADDRAQGMAVVAGLADARQWQALRPVLDTTRQAGPYLEKYILEAYFRMNDADAGLARMKDRYRKMVDSPLSTLWEGWDIGSATYGGGTYNHGWSGGPLSLLSGYVAGIQPETPGYARFRVRPQPGPLRQAEARVETVRGRIETSLRREEHRTVLSLTVPAGTEARVSLPREAGRAYRQVTLNGRAAWKAGRGTSRAFETADESHLTFRVSAGTWTLIGTY